MSLSEDKYSSLEEMYVDNGKLVFVFLMDYTEDRQLIEELSRVVWEKAALHREKLLGLNKNEVKHYLRKVARTSYLDYRRQVESDRVKLEKLMQNNTVYTTDGGIARTDAKICLENALNSLTTEERKLLVLRQLHGLNAAEVGAKLGISEENVRVRQGRILKKCRKVLGIKTKEGGK